MPAGGEILICGAYNLTYGGVAVGMFEGEAGVPTLEPTAQAENVDKTDRYGRTLIDFVYLGTNWRAMMTAMEYRAGSLAALYPWGTLGLLGTIGRLGYNMSAALVMTAIAGTPASATPATVTASKAILAPNFPSKLLFGPTVRKVPLQMLLLPYDTGAGVVGALTST